MYRNSTKKVLQILSRPFCLFVTSFNESFLTVTRYLLPRAMGVGGFVNFCYEFFPCSVKYHLYLNLCSTVWTLNFPFFCFSLTTKSRFIWFCNLNLFYRRQHYVELFFFCLIRTTNAVKFVLIFLNFFIIILFALVFCKH